MSFLVDKATVPRERSAPVSTANPHDRVTASHPSLSHDRRPGSLVG